MNLPSAFEAYSPIAGRARRMSNYHALCPEQIPAACTSTSYGYNVALPTRTKQTGTGNGDR
ncbi:hypothetical protein IE4803_PD00310 (plasmid) [Rhizobium etli bv. phaseoli str. IE4803]|nr:hypothetical protein IE4803_PD00310 [Rhizobium etli bv. phaseoli str. IE4803]